MQILFIMSVTALLQTFNKPLSCGTKATSCTFYKVRSLFLLYIKALKKKNTEFVQPFRVSLHLSLSFFFFTLFLRISFSLFSYAVLERTKTVKGALLSLTLVARLAIRVYNLCVFLLLSLSLLSNVSC